MDWLPSCRSCNASIKILVGICHPLPWLVLMLSSCQAPPGANIMPSVTVLVPASTVPSFTANPISTPVNSTPSLRLSTVILTSKPSPFPTNTVTVTVTATPIGLCSQRKPNDDLLIIINKEYGISREYAPGDLVRLVDYFPREVTMGYATEVRAILIKPLQRLIQDMQVAGMRPRILSGYRNFEAQTNSWEKWQTREPERAPYLSVPPGHSEHQLGIAIDFSSPELAAIIGQEDAEFDTRFEQTSEGVWLAENAHKYGFTLSYSLEAFPVTGVFYEPWHYRYVGTELATQLHQRNETLSEYQLQTQPPPCIP